MKASILVVEDERVVAREVQATLRRRGYRVGVATSAEECLTRARKRPPDLVLMDIGLGHGADGVQAARSLRDRHRVPVVFLTGLGDRRTVARALQTDPAGYLVKPFEERQLVASVEVALARARQESVARDGHARDARELSRARLQVREEEVRRISRELHDEAGQILSGLHMALAEVAAEVQPPARQRLREVRGLLDRVQGELRRIAHDMRPSLLDDLGLVPALEFLAKGVSARTDVRVTVSGAPGRLPPLVETVLYRVVQEALTNVVRHAAARVASVYLSRGPRTIRCSIRDDGRGFDPEPVGEARNQGLGLLGMHERVEALNGTLRMQSEPGFGTEIVVSIPTQEALSLPVS